MYKSKKNEDMQRRVMRRHETSTYQLEVVPWKDEGEVSILNERVQRYETSTMFFF